jgi:ABC-type Fe3+-hydroxamate transport system substrate-binding protein
MSPRLLILALCAALALTGCGGGTSQQSATSTSPTAAIAASPDSSTASASGKPSAAAAGLTVIRVPGYTYTAPPAELKRIADGMDATGMVTSVVGRGVKDGSGTRVGAIMLTQYNPKLTVLMDKKPASELLTDAVKGIKAFTPGKVTVTDRVLSGTPVRLVQDASTSMAMVYLHGGKLIEVRGPNPAEVLRFTGAYLKASASH